MNEYFVYILKCSDNTLYTGITTDVERRIKEHSSFPAGAQYTKGRGPVELLYQKKFPNRSEASIEECRIKKLTRAQKLLLLQK